YWLPTMTSLVPAVDDAIVPDGLNIGNMLAVVIAQSEASARPLEGSVIDLTNPADPVVKVDPTIIPVIPSGAKLWVRGIGSYDIDDISLATPKGRESVIYVVVPDSEIASYRSRDRQVVLTGVPAAAVKVPVMAPEEVSTPTPAQAEESARKAQAERERIAAEAKRIEEERKRSESAQELQEALASGESAVQPGMTSADVRTIIDGLKVKYETAEKAWEGRSEELAARIPDYKILYEGISSRLESARTSIEAAEIAAIKALAEERLRAWNAEGKIPEITPEEAELIAGIKNLEEMLSFIEVRGLSPIIAPAISFVDGARQAKITRGRRAPYEEPVDVMQYLMDRAFNIKLKVDGMFGTNTRNALIKLQTQNGLGRTGELNSETAALLISGLLKDPLVRQGLVEHLAARKAVMQEEVPVAPAAEEAAPPAVEGAAPPPPKEAVVAAGNKDRWAAAFAAMKEFDKFNSTSRRHPGTDFYVPEGTAVQSILPGKVVFAGSFDEIQYSNYYPGAVVIKIDGYDNLYAIYAHINPAEGIAAGQDVAAGTIIGKAG
ncbi:MAG TPA: peptidoglycan DD-metalloendopeptidase family protein, partial [Candidatus Omnitrophota bacterium]|nr:peptidoglycan DD-metalloendopeptidase family protein [Candidatus Omnitrophota bacterium]